MENILTVLYSKIFFKGPSDPYYFGLTVAENTKADFGVNCDMPGLHFDDTCVTNDDCSDFPNTGKDKDPPFKSENTVYFQFAPLFLSILAWTLGPEDFHLPSGSQETLC